MINIEFKDFWDIIEKERLNNPVSTIHASIQDIGIIFMTKTKEDIDYYTYIYFEDIAVFSENNDISFDEAFENFKVNYLSNVQLFKDYNMFPSIPVQELAVEESNDDVLPPNSEEILKEVLYKESDDIDAGSDMIEESKDYSGFLLGFFNKLEKKVLTAVSKLDDEIVKDFSSDIKTKTLGDFLKDLFNIVNTKTFIANVRKYLKMDLLKGMYEAEKETGLDIGFTDNYQAKLNQLASQQLDGYTINGKKWMGIKGVTKEIQHKVISTVQDGINKELSLNEIKDNVKDTFEGFSDWRAKMIARTETTNIVNEAKIIGYKETKIKGKKKWSAAMDNRTSEICKRLHGMKVGLDDYFIDPITRKAYFRPAAHVNCRCVLNFSPD
jgi:SPP1 gp7 family putative phage head morphogenesis protein